MSKKRQMSKKEITDLVAYVTILVHNNKIDEVMDAEEIEKMMRVYSNAFDSTEEKALQYLEDRVLVLKEKLYQHKLEVDNG